MNFSGIRMIDDQHVGLLEAVIRARKWIESGSEFAALLTLLGQLEDYTVTHFQTEEKMMEANGYFDTEGQKKEHVAFVSKVHDFTKQLTAGDEPKVLEILDFVELWLIKHIDKEAVLFRTHLSKEIDTSN